MLTLTAQVEKLLVLAISGGVLAHRYGFDWPDVMISQPGLEVSLSNWQRQTAQLSNGGMFSARTGLPEPLPGARPAIVEAIRKDGLPAMVGRRCGGEAERRECWCWIARRGGRGPGKLGRFHNQRHIDLLRNACPAQEHLNDRRIEVIGWDEQRRCLLPLRCR